MPRMTAPRTGVKIRMYRQGHGDCFLLAFAGREGNRKRTVYVLIDCGLKPKSEIKNQKIDKIIDDIQEATDGHVDVVVVTHEHQDHVNGFAKKKSKKHLFDKITFGQCWLAWTEDGTDDLANALRERFHDTLVTLAFAQEKVTALGLEDGLAERLSDLIGLEVGDDGTVPAKGHEGAGVAAAFRAAAEGLPHPEAGDLNLAAVKGITNKNAIKYLRDRAVEPERFLGPDRPPETIPHLAGSRVYALGPPRDIGLLLDLDPTGSEEFHLALGKRRLAMDGDARSFAQAVAPESVAGQRAQPFSRRYRIAADKVLGDDDPPPEEDRSLTYLRTVYGGANPGPDLAWRRIDDEWLGAAEGIALRLNNEVNNTSLVLAIELPKSGKVLLFTGDAQRGNWIGWSELAWPGEDGGTVTARDLLARTVFYKVGHHGSHNATLNGTDADDYPNLGWMARGPFADEFTAAIPANTEWALGKSNPWVHPLPQIEAALLRKAKGRVFRSDKDNVERPEGDAISDAEWADFQSRTNEADLYFEYLIEDR